MKCSVLFGLFGTRTCRQSMDRMIPADTDALRSRLLDLRRDALAQLSETLPVVDCGLLRLVADISATLGVLDAERQQ